MGKIRKLSKRTKLFDIFLLLGVYLDFLKIVPLLFSKTTPIFKRVDESDRFTPVD